MDIKKGSQVSLTVYSDMKNYIVKETEKRVDGLWVLLDDGIWYNEEYIREPFKLD